jgi:beta-galactosidase
VDFGKGFVPVSVPGCWDLAAGSRRIAGPVTWRKEFTCPPGKGDGAWHLRFDAVSYFCEISLNGTSLGSHEGAWDRFKVDVSRALRPGDRNELLLRVEKPGYLPGDRFPFREVLSGFIPDVLCTFGGIWGDVELVQSDPLLPEYCRVTTNLARGTASIRLQIPPSEAVPGAKVMKLRLSA